MTDGINIDYGALKQPDYVGNYVNAFRVGQDLGKQAAVQNAGRGSFKDHPDSAKALADVQAQIGAMSEPERLQSQQRNEAIMHVLIGLKSVPQAQRLMVAQHLARSSGLLDPAGIAPVDVTDAGIEGHIHQAVALGQLFNLTAGADQLAP